jgi:DNA sulfur modification protein DndD
LDVVKRKLATIPDPLALEELVAERNTLKTALMEKEVELKVVGDLVDSCSSRVEHQEQKVDTLVDLAVEEDFAKSDAGRSAATIDRVIPVLAEFSRRVTRLNLARLETLIVESLGQLLHKKALLSRIKIALDTLRLQLYDRDGRELRPEHISAGERQLLAVSMVWGLAKASNRPLPTIIDTPLGRLDSKHRVHLVERYFPSASHQVILLSTDEEVNEKYYQMLKPAVGRSFRLEFDEETQSTNVTPGYFW